PGPASPASTPVGAGSPPEGTPVGAAHAPPASDDYSLADLDAIPTPKPTGDAPRPAVGSSPRLTGSQAIAGGAPPGPAAQAPPVIAGVAIGVLLGLVLAYQSFQALAYKNHFSDGVAALKRGANDIALVEFSSSISANKNSADAYLYRALAEVRLGDFQHAMND